MRIRKALLLLLSILLLSSVSYAADRSGQEILDDLAFSNVLSGSGVAELNLITENARGQQRKYSVKVYLKSDDAGDRQFLEYLSPADVRGTKFLSQFGGPGRSDVAVPTCNRQGTAHRLPHDR